MLISKKKQKKLEETNSFQMNKFGAFRLLNLKIYCKATSN